MELFIANCTKQDHQFTYMLFENTRPFMERIRAGAQIKIKGTHDEIDQIIKQHEVYGLIPVEKIKGKFSGMAYKLDKPINVEAIENGIDVRDQTIIDRATEARKITAVASDQHISEKAQQMGLKQKAPLEIEIVEEKKNFTDNEPKFEQTIEVVKDGIAPKGRGRPRKT